MSTTHTPKSLVFVSLGIGLALLLIIIPVWLGDNREIVDVVEVQDAPEPAPSLVEEQKETIKTKQDIEPNAHGNPSSTIAEESDRKEKQVSSILEPSGFESDVRDVQSSEIDVGIEKKQVSSTRVSKVPTIDEKTQRVENVGRLNENLQNRANSFINENQIRNTSKLSLEEKSAKVNNVDDFTQKTISRIEDFQNKRP